MKGSFRNERKPRKRMNRPSARGNVPVCWSRNDLMCLPRPWRISHRGNRSSWTSNIKIRSGTTRAGFLFGFRWSSGLAISPATPLSVSEARPQDTGVGWADNTDQVPDASRITPPVQHPSEGPINPLTLQIDLAPGFLLDRVESPTHPIRFETNGNGTTHIDVGRPFHVCGSRL